MSDERPLKPGQRRAIAKPRVTGKYTVWNVYDVQRASYPVHLPGFGRVNEGFTDEASCQAEADRLEEFFTAQREKERDR